MPERFHFIGRLVLSYLLYNIPLFCVFGYGKWFAENNQLNNNLLTATLVISAIPFVLSVFYYNLITKALLVVNYVSVVIQMFAISMHWHLYEQPINASTMFILMETNYMEASEFIEAYNDRFLIGMVIFFVAISILVLKYFSLLMKNVPRKKWNWKTKLITPVASMVCLTIWIKYAGHFSSTVLGYAYAGYEDYMAESALYDETGFGEPLGNLKPIKRNDPADKETYLIIIGESTASSHMSLYGYSRQTTPKLESVSHKLQIYKNVISPHTHTIPVLSKMLTPGNYEDLNKKYDASLVQLFNAAGFETHWISNQRPVGVYENLVTKIAQACTYKTFTNTLGNNKKTPFDEVLTDHVKTAYESSADKKAIFVHLLGTHAYYKYRYPSRFNIFEGSSGSQLSNNSDKAIKVVNEYDNAVLYNDFVVHQLFVTLDSIEEHGFGLYLSDHGEDVYEQFDCACHTETKGTEPMYRIPFLLYLSNKYKADSTMVFDVNRPYMMDDLFHSVAHLANISNELTEPGRSIFSIDFKPRKRIINGIDDFDQKFKTD
ncbi:MAG: sulfatase-like hydrolase/transferase [Salibacteraceae bacterium]